MKVQIPAGARAALDVALGFLREHTPESSTRLCAVLCCVTGCVVALATARFAFLHPDHAGAITALTGVTSALIASGCVAIVTRTRKTDGDAGGDQ